VRNPNPESDGNGVSNGNPKCHAGDTHADGNTGYAHSDADGHSPDSNTDGYGYSYGNADTDSVAVAMRWNNLQSELRWRRGLAGGLERYDCHG
jgi:hypothetical protein